MKATEETGLSRAQAPRAWTLAARACLAVAFVGWVATVAGYAQHQERLDNTASTAVSLQEPERLLDRISSWALLHDAKYFARYRSTLDPGRGFQKFYWLNAVEAAGLLIGLAATVWPFSTARILASGLLAMGQAADLPESAVEIVANYRALGVPLPSYRVAQVVGAATVPLASLAAAMVLGWNPVSPGPDVTAVVPPPPEARGCNRLQASLERAYLGAIDRVRRPALLAAIASMWVCTAVGCAGYAVGVASGAWWRTHVPLCGIALAVQLVANTSCVVALLPAVQGRGAGTALAATGCALAVSIWRINRSWAGGVTLVAVRTGVQPPPGYILFNAGVILWLLAAATIMTFMGFRRPQAGDERLRALPYRVIIFAAAGPIALAGVLLCTAATLVTNSQEDERRMWAGEVAFSQSGDRWWLMYTLVVYYTIAPKPFHTFCPMVLARSRETMVFGSLIVALGTNYMVNKSTNAAVNAGLWLIAVGFILEAVMTVLATDSPLGAHSWPGRAWRAVAGACTGGRRRTPGLQPLLLVARATDAEAGGPHTVRLLLPKDGAGVEGGGGKGRPAARPAATDVVLQRLIGTGSFSSVFKGTYGATPVAVKVLSAVSPSAQAAARQEARLALSLRHPCVLQTFAVLDVDVPASALADAAAGDSSKSASPGGARLALDAASVALAEFAAVLQAAPGAGGQLLEGAGSSRSRPSGSDATTGSPVPTVPQTWIVQQLADRGTLEHAIRKGVFHRRGRVGVGVGGGSSASPPDAAAAAGGRLGGKGGRTNRLTPVNPTAALLATLHDVASGLAYLHKVGIAHGDLKSANILLTTRSTGSCPSGRQWAAFIADFGLSRALAPAPGVPPAGDDPGPHTHILTHTFGTAAYTAPEIVREGRLSARADCYAFSIVMFEGWAGRQPYAGFPAASIFYRVGVEGRRPSLDGFGDAPPGYVALMTALWADAAYERPTAADAARALGAMLEAEVGAVAASGSAGEPRVEEGRARLAVDGAAPPPSPPPRVVGAEE